MKKKMKKWQHRHSAFFDILFFNIKPRICAKLFSRLKSGECQDPRLKRLKTKKLEPLKVAESIFHHMPNLGY